MESQNGNDSCFIRLEELIAEDVGRNIQPLRQYSQGALRNMVLSIQNTDEPVILILSGFFIPHATPPAPETDGLTGSLILASVFDSIGIKCYLMTDSHSFDAFKTGAEMIGLKKETVLNFSDKNKFRTIFPMISHVISIECPGPAQDGKTYNMSGKDISAFTAPLYQVAEQCENAQFFAVGDGGNEVGMGKVPFEVLQNAIYKGDLIACRIPCDELIVAGVSNWGAYAIICGLMRLKPDWCQVIEKTFCEKTEIELLKRLVDKQLVVDGVTGRCEVSVDGFPGEFHQKKIKKMLELSRNE